MEGGIIEEDNGNGWNMGQKDLLNPGEEGIGIDAALEQVHRSQLKAEQRADDVSVALGMPIPVSGAALPDGRIARLAGYVPGKAALVNPHRLDALPRPFSGAGVLREGFF